MSKLRSKLFKGLSGLPYILCNINMKKVYVVKLVRKREVYNKNKII